jgi:phospholipid transport system substrate-binding protein
MEVLMIRLVVVACMLLGLVVNVARAESSASSVIEAMASEAVSALVDANMSSADKEAKFRQILDDNFNVELIGQWVLGRYWNRATEAEKAEYMTLFEEHLLQSYFRKFSSYYSGQRLEVVKELVAEGGDTVVFSNLVGQDGKVIASVNWRLRSNKIIDVMVEGLSMGQTQRADFASSIRANGGEVSGFLAALRKNIEANK